MSPELFLTQSHAHLIAVDGPAASGKGTIAQRLAELYTLPYLDTGLLYRAVALDAGPDCDEAAAFDAARRLTAEQFSNPLLRTRRAGEMASRVAVFPIVRAALLDFQRRFAERPGGAVLDGRDIGTVIAPDAAAKLFITARPEVRADRRWRQLVSQGEVVRFDEVLADIVLRDERDSGRASAPLLQASDAVLLDTSEMDIPTSVEAARRIVEAARGRRETSRLG